MILALLYGIDVTNFANEYDASSTFYRCNNFLSWMNIENYSLLQPMSLFLYKKKIDILYDKRFGRFSDNYNIKLVNAYKEFLLKDIDDYFNRLFVFQKFDSKKKLYNKLYIQRGI